MTCHVKPSSSLCLCRHTAIVLCIISFEQNKPNDSLLLHSSNIMVRGCLQSATLLSSGLWSNTLDASRTWLIVAAHVTLPDAKLFTLTWGLAFQPSLALAFITSYMTYYTLLDPIGGVSMACISLSNTLLGLHL